MANTPQTVDVSVSVSKGKNGMLEVHVKPWQIHLCTGDTLEWVPGVHNNDDIVDWIRIDKKGNAKDWPFDDAPPHADYTGVKAKGKNPKSPRGRKGGLTIGTVVQYTITIGFTDDDGNDRVVTIDPDMVIDAG